MRLRPVAGRRHVDAQRPRRMLQRPRRVDRHVAALIGGKRKGHVVDDDVHPLREVVDRRNVIEIGRHRGKRDRCARRDVVHDLDHHCPFLSAIEVARAERSRLDQLGRFPGDLRSRQSDHAVRNHGHANPGTVDIEPAPRSPRVERFVAFGQRIAGREARVLRPANRHDALDRPQIVKQMRSRPPLPASEFRYRQLDLEPRLR